MYREPETRQQQQQQLNQKLNVLKCPKNFTMKLSYNFIKITQKQRKVIATQKKYK